MNVPSSSVSSFKPIRLHSQWRVPKDRMAQIQQDWDLTVPRRREVKPPENATVASQITDQFLGQKRKAPYSLEDRAPNPTTAVPTINNMTMLNDVDPTENQVQSTVTVPTTKPTNDTTDEHGSTTGRQDIHASERVAKLIEQYCDPSKWTDQESREGFMDYEVEEDGFAPNAYGDDDSDEDEDENQRSFLTQQERSGLIKLLSGSDTEDPVEKVKRWAPKGLVLSGKQLMAAIHPDRFPQAEQKQMAHKAFVSR